MSATARTPAISTAPLHPGEKSHYTEYRPAEREDRQRVTADVRAVLNGSLISRCLAVITRNGESKNFETITGEDGLTFGIKDFTSGTVPTLVARLAEDAPAILSAAFGEHEADVRSAAWQKANVSKRNDLGYVAVGWLREGLDRLLCDRRLHELQLELFRRETMEPSVAICRDAGRGWNQEFTLAALAGVANSFGGGGTRSLVKEAEAATRGSDERVVIRRLLETYALRDASTETFAATKRLLRLGFGDETGEWPDADDLKHSGRRVLALFQTFPWAADATFGDDLGGFTLALDEKLPTL